MPLVRFLLVVVLTFTASFSGAMEAGHMPASAHGHAPTETIVDDQPICCQDSTERTHSCHAFPALLPAASGDNAPAPGEEVLRVSGLLLNGFEPSGLLDPPRAM
ncbi:MAG: hypothetical protein ABJO75_07835 [Sedimentitalea sp.]|uniref:hypothetical protein n=1 Tax=Sedimentitalea sp. TaxID=2048915 RepID=UPI0032641B0E